MADPQPREAGGVPVRSRGWILAALMLTMMLAAMDTTIVSTAIPQVVRSLGGFALFTWMFSVYLLAQTVTIPVYGKLADLFGRKPVLIIGAVIFLAGSAASAGAWNMISLIVFRGIQGIGAGSIMSTVTTLSGDLYSVRERGRIQGWLSSVWGIAAIVGPTLGGALAEYATWRWIFLINLPIGVAALTFIGIFLHEKVERHRHRIDYAGASLTLLAGASLIFGLLQGGQSWAWLSAPSAAVFGAAVLLAGAAMLVERRAAEPIMPGWLWRRPVLAGANLAMIGMGLVLMGPNTYLPTFTQSVLGLGPIGAGFVLASMSIGWPTASALSSRAYMRFGFRDTALFGAVLVVAASIAFLAMPFPGSVWAVVGDQIFLGAGFGLLSTPLLVGVQSTVGWQRRGVVTGANMFSRYLGQSIGAAIFGAISNGVIAGRIAGAPSSLAGEVPRDVNSVIGALQGGGLSLPALDYLRRAIFGATRSIYAGLAIFAITTLVVVIAIPRRFESEEAVGDAPAASATPPASNVGPGVRRGAGGADRAPR